MAFLQTEFRETDSKVIIYFKQRSKHVGEKIMVNGLRDSETFSDFSLYFVSCPLVLGEGCTIVMVYFCKIITRVFFRDILLKMISNSKIKCPIDYKPFSNKLLLEK